MKLYNLLIGALLSTEKAQLCKSVYNNQLQQIHNYIIVIRERCLKHGR